MLMKTFSIIVLFSAFCIGCNIGGAESSMTDLLEQLQAYVHEIENELDSIPEDRKLILTEIASTISARLETGQDAKLTFICTHNSRRSHMSQIWAQTAAHHYGLNQIYTYSGGTETTACNCRTISAMNSVGFSIKNIVDGKNPVYLATYSKNRPPIKAYSKLYNADDNPKKGFIALMTCSKADKMCPVVEGAIARYAIHYVDPGLCDDTPEETSVYNARCREIAREMFYIMLEVRKQL